MATLFNLDDIENIDTTPKVEVKQGDLFQLGNHRLLCADCTIKENIDLLMNGKKADMVFTDAPYGYWLIWDKQIPKNNNFSDGEMCWTNIKTNLKIYRYLWNGMIRCEKEKRIHPTQKPISLLAEIITDFSKKELKK